MSLVIFTFSDNNPLLGHILDVESLKRICSIFKSLTQPTQCHLFFVFFTFTSVLHESETCLGFELKTASTFAQVVITGIWGRGPLQNPGVSRTPSPQGQEFERESHRGDSEAKLANTPAGSLITLSTLLLSGLLFQQHYSHTRPCLPGNYTAELVLMEGGTVHSLSLQYRPQKMWVNQRKKKKSPSIDLNVNPERVQDQTLTIRAEWSLLLRQTGLYQFLWWKVTKYSNSSKMVSL